MGDKIRAGNQMVFIWGVSSFLFDEGTITNTSKLNANAIPIAMQTITQLLLHPKVHASVLEEISAAKTGPTSFDMKKVTSSPRYKSLYTEALRWATASPSPRVVKHDIKLGQYNLKKGNMAIVHSRTLQMDHKTWSIPGVPESDPETFWPERFLEEDDSHTESHSVSENAEAEANYSNDVLTVKQQSEKARKAQEKEEKARTLSLRPFGGGTTLCPGRHFANNEVMGGIAALLLRLEIEVVQEELEKNGVPKPGLKKQGGLLPDRPLIVRVRRRRG
jgi:cytochrome P450